MNHLQQHDNNTATDVVEETFPLTLLPIQAKVQLSVNDMENAYKNNNFNKTTANNSSPEEGVIAPSSIEAPSLASPIAMALVVQLPNIGHAEDEKKDCRSLGCDKQEKFISNQETETVAMVDDLMNALTPPTTTPIGKTTILLQQHHVAAPEEIVKTIEGISEESEKSVIEVVAPTSTNQPAQVELRLPAIIYGRGSLKNTRRNKNITTLNGRGSLISGSEAIGIASGGSGNIVTCCGVVNADGNAAGCSKCITNIKTSLSMTSLPPDEKHQQSREVIKDKLNIDRPYNSLKNNADRCNSFANSNIGGNTSITNKQLHRYSWGSGYSQSSSSFHEDFISLSFQTNYNYIMDTNLLDTCKEARCEIEHGAANVLQNSDGFCFKKNFQMLDGTHQSESALMDPKKLRKWLREMEHKLETAPSVSQATLFSIADLQRHLAEHSVLYHEIVSHARVVNACIRTASEKIQQQRDKDQKDLINSSKEDEEEESSSSKSLFSTDEAKIRTITSTEVSASFQEPVTPTDTDRNRNGAYCSTNIPSSGSSTTSSTSKRHLTGGNSGKGNLERLQNRYHLLYLKAFEVQLWLDGLLRKKSSSVSSDYDDDDQVDVDLENDDDDDDDENDGFVEYDLNDVASDLESDVVTNNSSSLSYCDLQRSYDKNTTNTYDTSKFNNIIHSGAENDDELKHYLGPLNPAIVASTIEETYQTQKKQLLLPQQSRQRDCTRNNKVDESGEAEEEFEADDEDEVDFAYSDRDGKRSKLSSSSVPLTYDQTVVAVSGNGVACVTSFGGASVVKRPSVTLTDFEADSESSDWEMQLAQPRQQQMQYRKIVNGDFAVSNHKGECEHEPSSNLAETKSTGNAPLTSAINFGTTFSENQVQVANNTMHESASLTQNHTLETCNKLHNANSNMSSMHIISSSPTLVTLPLQPQHQIKNMTLHTHNNSNCNQKVNPNVGGGNIPSPITKQKNVAIISPNQHNANAVNPKTPPTVLRKRHVDISKFNRSNRKSKNCAIFYFRHMDTDNETNFGALSSSASHTSDLLKSADATSDDDDEDDGGWQYSSAAIPTTSATAGTIIIKHKNGGGGGSIDFLDTSIQSSDVSSSTNGSASAITAAAAEDSAKENKKSAFSSVLSNSSTSSTTQITIAEIQFVADTTANVTTSGNGTSHRSSTNSSTNSFSGQETKPLNGCRTIGDACAGNCDSSSSSSNERLTDTTTQMHCKQQQHQLQQPEQRSIAIDGVFRSEMEIQIIGNGGIVGGSNNADSNLYNRQHSNNNKNINTNYNNNNNNNINNNNNNLSNDNNNHHEVEMKNIQQLPILQHRLNTDVINGNAQKEKAYFHTRADICNITVKPSPTAELQQHQLEPKPTADPCHSYINNYNKGLPPRSPAKSGKSYTSVDSVSTLSLSPAKGKVSHESIKQLVLGAEHLVRDEALKTPTNQQQQNHHNSLAKILSTVKKREVIMPGPIKQRVQEWLEHQPSHALQQSHRTSHDLALNSAVMASERTDDCEASGEASETDSIPHHGSDTSEGFTDSIATCMQTSTNSFGNSTERIGGSAEPIGAVVSTILMTTSTTTTATTASTTMLGDVAGGGSGCGSSYQSLNIKTVKRRQQMARRKSERPWSVSGLSQLTTESSQAVTASSRKVAADVQAGLATHSISESALDSLSPSRRPRASSTVIHPKNYDNKGSLKRRKTRKKKSLSSSLVTTGLTFPSSGKKTDSGSDISGGMVAIGGSDVLMPKLSKSLVKSWESMSPEQIQEITTALLGLQNADGSGSLSASSAASTEQITLVQQTSQIQQRPHQQQQHLQSPSQLQQLQNESDNVSNQLKKPNFRVGSYTTAYMSSETRLGSLAALANYMNDEGLQGEYTTGTDDHHSSFSETAWDNYQEKYNSENYSEGFDSDAARRLMEFGDDYRNFIDSQSDCCSSLSAANNLDSLSPPRMDSLQKNETKILSHDNIVSSVDHARRRRALELEYERRRKTLEVRRKSCQDSVEIMGQNPRSPTISLSSSANALTPKNTEKYNFQHKMETANRKLDYGGMIVSHSAQSLRRTSESDTSTRRRKVDERRRSSRNLEKSIKPIPATSSSSCDNSDDEKEMRNLLQKSRNRLEDTRALKIRCHLLRPEDYAEIINTCRDNIRCLESVLRGPPGSVLSAQCVSQTKDILSAWEDLLCWSENAAAARKLQEEMITLKHALNRLGNKTSFELLDTEPSIQIAIEALKNEKSQLQTYRTSMLHLNASVHGWLTRQERKLQTTLEEQQAAMENSSGMASSIKTKTALDHVDTVESEYQLNEAMASEEDVATLKTTATIIVTDNNSEQFKTYDPSIDSHSGIKNPAISTGTSTTEYGEKTWDLNSLVNSEQEFHKHLKDEVSDMYTAWDEADARINSQLEVLTTSLIAWRQLESGLFEFQQALGQDRGTLKGLEGALDKGQTTPVELAQNVKFMAKLLSEKVIVSQEQLTAVQEHLDPKHILHIAKFTASTGSLSDSGISDGGATSDGGLSERERRLGVLRRLAKQLESALAPGSDAMKSIAARMESAEAELKNLQNTCRDLIVRTATTHQNKKQQMLEAQQKKDETEKKAQRTANDNGYLTTNRHISGEKSAEDHTESHLQHSASQLPSKRKNNRKQRKNTAGGSAEERNTLNGKNGNGNCVSSVGHRTKALEAGGDGDPNEDFNLDTSDDDEAATGKRPKRGWAWRIVKAAVPLQLVLFTFLAAATLMQPNCCDNLNNLSMSFTPQLRYIRGPPPI